MTRGPTITYVTDPSLHDDAQRTVIRELIAASAEYCIRVAIRLPGAGDKAVSNLLDWYLAESTETNMLPVLIHNRPSIAKRLPQVRLWLPSRLMESGSEADVWSVHSTAEALQAKWLGAREVVFGHVFATKSHPGEASRGVEALQQVAAIPGLKVTAIGGIDERSIDAIGVNSVACIRAISQSPDIASTLSTMRIKWKGTNS